MELWDKFGKKKISITHLKTETTGHSRVESHRVPTQGFPHLCPTLHHPVQHLLHEHLGLCFAMCMELNHVAALPSTLICFCRRKTFLLYLSKHTAEGKYPLSSHLWRKNWLICRWQSLVLSQGWLLQSTCILCHQQKSSVLNVDILLVILWACW